MVLIHLFSIHCAYVSCDWFFSFLFGFLSFFSFFFLWFVFDCSAFLSTPRRPTATVTVADHRADCFAGCARLTFEARRRTNDCRSQRHQPTDNQPATAAEPSDRPPSTASVIALEAMSSSLPPSSLAALAKIGVIRLDAEYKHEGGMRVNELFEAAAAAALGRSDFTQPLKVRSAMHAHARTLCRRDYAPLAVCNGLERCDGRMLTRFAAVPCHSSCRSLSVGSCGPVSLRFCAPCRICRSSRRTSSRLCQICACSSWRTSCASWVCPSGCACGLKTRWQNWPRPLVASACSSRRRQPPVQPPHRCLPSRCPDRCEPDTCPPEWQQQPMAQRPHQPWPVLRAPPPLPPHPALRRCPRRTR